MTEGTESATNSLQLWTGGKLRMDARLVFDDDVQCAASRCYLLSDSMSHVHATLVLRGVPAAPCRHARVHFPAEACSDAVCCRTSRSIVLLPQGAELRANMAWDSRGAAAGARGGRYAAICRMHVVVERRFLCKHVPLCAQALGHHAGREVLVKPATGHART